MKRSHSCCAVIFYLNLVYYSFFKLLCLLDGACIFFLICSLVSAEALFNGDPYTGSLSQIVELQQIASANRASIANPPISSPTSSLNVSISKHQNTSEATILEARAIIVNAIAQASATNKARFEKPLRNTYTSHHSSSAKKRGADILP
jgi:hypothetical protein